MSRAHGKLVRLAAFILGLAMGTAILYAAGMGRRKELSPPEPGPAAAFSALSAAPTEIDPAIASPPRFVDVTAASGITFRHENGMTGKFAYPEIMGAGVGLIDHDGDGLLDIYFVNGNRLDKPTPDITNRLYRSNGDWTYTDVTGKAGVPGAGFGQGCCVGDYDGDGDPDLYVSNLGPNLLYRNEGDGTFSDVAAAAGVTDPGWGQTCSFLDYDLDGRLDLYVQNYLTYNRDRQVEAIIYLGTRKVPDYPTPLDFPGSASHLYHNRGDGTFADVTRESGVMKPDGKGMGTVCADLDDDGFPDIFVANDTMENYYFHNLGNGTFEEIGLSAGLAFDTGGTPKASMGVDLGDFDRDGRPDLVCPCLKMQGFTLSRNLGGNSFADASSASGLFQITSESTGFSVNFLDYDNDADLDLFFSNGGVRANEMVPAGAPYSERYGFHNLLVAGDGRGRFRDVSHLAGPHFQERMIGRGSAAGDLDNDGDIDLVISRLAGKAVVLRNETAPRGHWVTLKLVPKTGNRDALGASVRVEAGGVTQRAAVHGAVSYLSQNDRRVHFGLAGAARINRLEVRWPDRQVQVLEGLPVDRILTIEEGAAAR